MRSLNSHIIPMALYAFLEASISVCMHSRRELHISIKNLDHKTHQIKIIFETGPRIMIYEGAESLLLKTDQGYQYTFSIESEDPDAEKIFLVKASLEEGASMATYPITMKIFVDGTKINADWDDVELTVKR